MSTTPYNLIYSYARALFGKDLGLTEAEVKRAVAYTKVDEQLTAAYGEDANKPVFTPFCTLGKEIVDRLPSITGNILVLSDAGLLISLLRRLNSEGLKLDRITFIAHTEKIHAFVQNLGVKSRLVGYNELQDWFKEAVTVKFDVVIGNPPYSNGLHMDFLEIGFKLLAPAGRLIFVHPSTEFIKQGSGRRHRALDQIGPKVVSLTLYNPDKHFPGIGIRVPLAITEISLDHVGSSTINIDGKSLEVSSFDSFSIHSLKPGWTSFKTEVLKLASAGNLMSKVLWSKNCPPKSYDITTQKFFIECNGVIGHNSSGLEVADMLNADCSVLILRSNAKIKTESELVGTKHKFVLAFETREEAELALDYIKSDFARAALSIYRYGPGIGPSHLRTVPWPPAKIDSEYLATLPVYSYE